MSCCGNKRAAFAPGRTAGSAGHPVPDAGHPGPHAGTRPIPAASSKMWPDPHFENTGEQVVTMRGAMTGKLYRWAGKGDVRVVDYRDAGALRHQLKALKRIR